MAITWDSIQQVLRILIFAIGGYVFGDAVVNGEVFQGFAGGILNVGAFIWWWYWNKKGVEAPVA
ncbi:MAG: hypothetical protein Q8P46_07030 [Hyphomicrobiales bacterium]|nr:hypothetical protein [Hyphomicrobiales bacterium]